MTLIEKTFLNRRLQSALQKLLVAAAVLLLGTHHAQAASDACPSVITSCGCVITKPSTYTIANDLSASQTNQLNCIEIAADHAILNLKGFAMIGKGDGTGIGILIRNGAIHVVVEGGDEGSTTPPVDSGTNGQDFPAAQAVVTQWNIGIEDDGDDAVIALFKDLGGNIFQQQSGNATAGLFFKGANRSIAADFHASYNGAAGVMVQDSNGTRLSNFSAVGNQGTGVRLESSNDNAIGTASATGNGKYGMWLLDSSRNLISNCNGTSGNGDTGILLGCGSGGKCATGKKSDDNRIANSGAPGNQMAGIVIDKGNKNNIVTITHNDGNPDMHDMVDLNPHCSTNIWYNNTGTVSQSCIH